MLCELLSRPINIRESRLITIFWPFISCNKVCCKIVVSKQVACWLEHFCECKREVWRSRLNEVGGRKYRIRQQKCRSDFCWCFSSHLEFVTRLYTHIRSSYLHRYAELRVAALTSDKSLRFSTLRPGDFNVKRKLNLLAFYVYFDIKPLLQILEIPYLKPSLKYYLKK